MLDSINKGVCALAAAAMFLAAAPAQAETVEVIIGEESYFPAVVYVKAGDTLVFANQSGEAHTVIGNDGIWTTGPIPHDGQVSVTVDKDLHKDFSGTDIYDTEITANLSYADPPLE